MHDHLPFFATLGSRRQIWIWLGSLLWLPIVVGGMLVLARYEKQPGTALETSGTAATLGASTPGRFRLLMFAHPRCPCTAASIRELARVMSHCASRVECNVYFYQPEDAQPGWDSGPLWNAATEIPGVRVQSDPDGAIAARYAAATSGDVQLYDAAGRLRFHGGITSGRGHEGDNLGKSAVISLIAGEDVHLKRAPVYGCTLRTFSAPR